MKRNSDKSRKPQARQGDVKDRKDTRCSDDKRGHSNRTDGGRTSKSSSMDRLSPLNDFAWYDRNPLLTIGAASIPYPFKPGMFVELGETLPEYQIPGIMTLRWEPTIGYTDSPTDPASIAALEIYARVRDSFSGALDADAPDYVIYLMALDSIFAYIGALKRIYRILNAYNSMNYLIPDKLLEGLGLGSQTVLNLKGNRMQLFSAINELVGMCSKFRCPAVFNVFDRHYWLNDNVYSDAESANAQMYTFVMVKAFQFALLDTPAGVKAGGLQSVNTPFYDASSVSTVESLFNYGVSLINALAGSEDAYTISGYLQRAYADTPVFAVPSLLIDEVFTPVYVPEVLSQIENAWAISAWNGEGFDGNNVTQDPSTNALICTPKFTSIADGRLKPFINIRSDSPTLADTVEATRLKNFVTKDLKVICGTEILHDIYFTQSGANGLLFNNLDQWATIDVSDPTTAGANTAYKLLSLAPFDWHPFAVVRMFSGTAAGVVVGDIHNFTVLEADQLRQINKVCLYSQFNSFGLR